VHKDGDDVRLRALAAALGDVGSSREARKESRSLGIFKGVSKTSEPSATSPPLAATTPEDLARTIKNTTTETAKAEKTTTTTATYYPKLSRTDRKDSITALEEPKPSKPAKREPVLPSALASLGYESESGDELGSTGPAFQAHQTVSLKPYSHQVGGHSALFKFSRHAVCKPLIEKENAFYQEVEINRPECMSTNPSFTYCYMFCLFCVLYRKIINFSTTIHAAVYWNLECHASGLSDG
jgi:hypothetical protein